MYRSPPRRDFHRHWLAGPAAAGVRGRRRHVAVSDLQPSRNSDRRPYLHALCPRNWAQPRYGGGSNGGRPLAAMTRVAGRDVQLQNHAIAIVNYYVALPVTPPEDSQPSPRPAG